MEPRIHIQHVLLSLQPGGLENGVVNVVNGLDPSRFRSSLCCLQSVGGFASRVRAADVSIYKMGLLAGNDYGLPWRLAVVDVNPLRLFIHNHMLNEPRSP